MFIKSWYLIMIDFHNHIIPNVDDGSKNIRMSIRMIKNAAEMGITKIVSTTHYNHPTMKERFPNFDNINSELDQLKKEMISNKLTIEIVSSAEVYFNEDIINFYNNDSIIIGKKYMLIEFDFNLLPKNYERILFELQLKGITPIIAHPERYTFVQKDYSIINEWINRDYILQLSCGSIFDQFGSSALYSAKKIIKNGHFHLVGSDAHNDSNRNFCLKPFLNFLKKNGGENNVDILMKNANKLYNKNKLDKCSPLIKKSIFNFSFFGGKKTG